MCLECGLDTGAEGLRGSVDGGLPRVRGGLQCHLEVARACFCDAGALASGFRGREISGFHLFRLFAASRLLRILIGPLGLSWLRRVARLSSNAAARAETVSMVFCENTFKFTQVRTEMGNCDSGRNGRRGKAKISATL